MRIGAHTEAMRTWLVAAVAVGILLLAGQPVLALVQATDQIGAGHAGSASAQPVVQDDPEQGEEQGKEQDEAGREHLRHGPPPWASHPRGPQAQVPGRHTLTPKQRARKMARLGQEHATAMRKWSACVHAGRTGCVRPLPPGLAKRSG